MAADPGVSISMATRATTSGPARLSIISWTTPNPTKTPRFACSDWLSESSTITKPTARATMATAAPSVTSAAR